MLELVVIKSLLLKSLFGGFVSHSISESPELWIAIIKFIEYHSFHKTAWTVIGWSGCYGCCCCWHYVGGLLHERISLPT